MRWRAQDDEGAVLRDELRQAAQLWEQHGRADDYLWMGTAFREYQLWRERYPGGLTAREESFAAAMTAFAQRRRRRRQIAVAAVIAALTTALAVFAVLRQQAVAQARRAEASKVLALGQLELETNPTVALAYAIKSLELEDTRAARVFALKALATGLPALLHTMLIRDSGPISRVSFSPDGAWAVVIGGAEKLHVVRRDDGSHRILQPFPSGTGGVAAVFDSESRHLYAAKDGLVRIWSVPAFDVVETQTLGGTFTWLWATPAGVLASTRVKDEPREVEVAAIAIGLPPRRIGRFEGITNWTIDSSGSALAFAKDKGLYIRSLADGKESPRRIGTFEGPPKILFNPSGSHLAAYDPAVREIRLWATGGDGRTPVQGFAPRFQPLSYLLFDPAGARLAALGTTPKGLGVDVWTLDGPATVGPRSFAASFGGFLDQAAFSPDGRWLATANFHAVCFWPLARSEARIFLGHRQRVVDAEFTPDNRRLVSIDVSGEVREWELGPGGVSRTLTQGGGWSAIRVDPRGRFFVVTQRGGARVVPFDGGESRSLQGFGPTTGLLGVAIDHEGRRVAATAITGPAKDKVIRVWDLETGDVRTLGPTEQAGEGNAGQNLGLRFLPDGSLLSAGEGGLRRWELPGGTSEVLAATSPQSHLAISKDGRTAAYIVANHSDGRADGAGPIASVSLAIMDLATRKTRTLSSHGTRIMPLEMDDRGEIVLTGGLDGIVRVGKVTGEEPHLLLGHEGFIHALAISPDRRWIASGGDDGTVRVWPMPDLSRPPLHTLPHDELLARLKSLTNVRVVEESASTISAWLRTARGSGYEIDVLPFPGWAGAPQQ